MSNLITPENAAKILGKGAAKGFISKGGTKNVQGKGGVEKEANPNLDFHANIALSQGKLLASGSAMGYNAELAVDILNKAENGAFNLHVSKGKDRD